MVLPLTLLAAARSDDVLVELKSGETFTGRLVAHDSHMNLQMTDVIRTNAEGTRFWKLARLYVRGNSVKYIRFSEGVAAKAKATTAARGGRGGATTRGRGATRGARGRRGSAV